MLANGMVETEATMRLGQQIRYLIYADCRIWSGHAHSVDPTQEETLGHLLTCDWSRPQYHSLLSYF